LNIAVTNDIVPGNIERIISSKGIKKCVVAQRAGLTAQAFNDMLNGRKVIRVKDLVALAKALEISPGDLFSTDDTRTA